MASYVCGVWGGGGTPMKYSTISTIHTSHTSSSSTTTTKTTLSHIVNELLQYQHRHPLLPSHPTHSSINSHKHTCIHSLHPLHSAYDQLTRSLITMTSPSLFFIHQYAATATQLSWITSSNPFISNSKRDSFKTDYHSSAKIKQGRQSILNPSEYMIHHPMNQPKHHSTESP